MTDNEQSANSNFAAGFGFQSNGDARFVSEKVRYISSKFKAKMSRIAKTSLESREGIAFEYLDAMDQAINLGGKYEVNVLGVNAKNSPDVSIKDRRSGFNQEQQHKRSSVKADKAAKSGDYGKQEIRTPKGQTKQPKNSKVKESNVSASEVNKGTNNPNHAASNYQFKAAMAEISNAAAMGAITGVIAATLISGLEHFLAVERGEIEIDQAIVAVFLDALEGAFIGGLSSAAFAAIPAFIPALVPVLNIISVPLMVIGGFQLVNQIGQILDRHEFIKRNALLTQVHKQESHFFERFDKQVMEYLYS
ncbi:hypothetical protein [Pseudanabaena sp. 'Roaring Creek']|uniref:hypothetical protein n=1 Tax=Pseudanabaena sp. 'Roaring Creek' TaxID=1681830 RepID=UPI0006D78A97|nr:hypothetical protein [Pseudanabaena sp. 'Roaring Creek']